MRKKLRSFVLPFLLFGIFASAQTKIWDFGNDTATWPMSTGIGTEPMVVDNLGLYPIPTNTNFGAVNSNNQTFSDGFSATQRFQMNGAGYPSGPFLAMPTQRYLFMGVSGPCQVKVWFRTGSNGATRTMHVSDGSVEVGSATTNQDGNGDGAILTTNYTGGAGTLYVYGSAACNLYKLEVTGATVETTLSLDSLDKLTTNVFGAGNQLFVQNVVSSTEVKVYGINGALIKSISTSSDTSFELNKGLYIVNVKSEEGDKSVKVLIN